MLPRERVLAALAHQATDRVPLDFWAVPEIWEKLKERFQTQEEEQILRHYEIDIRQFQPDYIGPEILVQSDGSYFDGMGIHRRKVRNKFSEYEEYASAPLGNAESAADLERYGRWPNIDHFDFSVLPRKIGEQHKTYYIKIETGGLFELAWALRGYEQFMLDMLEEPEIAHFIMDKLTTFYCEYVRRAMHYARDQIDMVYTYDDVASQRGPLMSKKLWAEFVRPYHVRLNQTIKEYGKTIMYHCCGAVMDFIDDFIALPIDVLNPLQPRAAGMDMDLIKQTFGDRVCFHGAIDIQHILPRGTVREVEENVRKILGALSLNGGFILTSAHYMQADTPLENIDAMYNTAKECPIQSV